MYRRVLSLCVVLAASVSVAVAIDNPQSQAKLTAAQVVDRNISARGGLQAWRAVQTLSMSGKLDAGNRVRPTLAQSGRKAAMQVPAPRPVEQVQLPFVMELKRPHKSRVEVQFKGQAAIQVYDGVSGWKLRPFLNRRDVESFTSEEAKASSMQSELDGPLVDYAAKGTHIELVAMEKVEDRDTYKLKLTLKSGQITNIWIDANTFLEAKIEGTPRRLDDQDHPVEIYYRDYRSVGGLKIPYVLETRVLNVTPIHGVRTTNGVSETMAFDKIEINPKLDDSLFSKAQLETAANGTVAQR
jgi:outer membrane lipoprotein-sorting protein